MSDSDRLLQTLRTIAEYCRPFPISQIAKDAADEIERLRAATPDTPSAPVSPNPRSTGRRLS